MEILISMKCVDDSRYSFKNPYMNDAYSQSNGFFVAEIRDFEDDKIKLLQKYSVILFEKLKRKGDYSIENTDYGFKLMRKINENKNYTEDWDEWAAFSDLLYRELVLYFEET